MKLPLVAGAATSIGSLPHVDPGDALDLVLRLHPLLPAAPQLPRRSPLEGMLAQWATGIAGVDVTPHGELVVDARRMDPDAPVDTTVRADSSAGLLLFLDAVQARRKPIKLQLTGPVTLGLALAKAGAPPALAFEVAGRAIQAKGRALVALARDRVPDAPLVVFLDEPGLTSCGHPGFPLAADPTIDLVSGALAALEPAITGVHCCGHTDWSLAIQAGASILSLPVAPGLVDDALTLATHLERGGWIAWGAIPTTGPLGDDAELPWRELAALWCELTRAGCDPVLLRRQALVTPACGLASHGISQAELVLRLTSIVSDRAQDQAIAARLSVGA